LGMTIERFENIQEACKSRISFDISRVQK
jgi:hypothetical protein